MSETAIREEIIDPMQRLFLPPKTMSAEQQALALREYMDALRGFEREDLQAAWKVARDSALTRSWPPIAVFIKAAYQAKNLRHSARHDEDRNRTTPNHRFDTDGWKAYWRANWNYLKFQPIAKEAARDGWCLMLKTCVLDGLPLADIDRSVFRRKLARIERLPGIIEADPDFPDRVKALELWRGVLVHRAEVQEEIANARGEGPPAPPIPPFESPDKFKGLNDPPEYQLKRAYG